MAKGNARAKAARMPTIQVGAEIVKRVTEFRESVSHVATFDSWPKHVKDLCVAIHVNRYASSFIKKRQDDTAVILKGADYFQHELAAQCQTKPRRRRRKKLVPRSRHRFSSAEVEKLENAFRAEEYRGVFTIAHAKLLADELKCSTNAVWKRFKKWKDKRDNL